MSNGPVQEREDIGVPRGAYESFLGIAAAGFVAFVLLVFALGYWGEGVVAGLDTACAEAVFDAANKLRSEGHDELAIQRFRQALGGQFRAEERRYMCTRALGDLLKKQERYDEAIEVYRALPADAFTFAGAYAGFVDALWKQGDVKEAEKAGKVWLAQAQAERDAEQMEWANSILLRLTENAGRLEEALVYGQAAVAANPKSDTGLIVARLLLRLGRSEEALQQLDAFVTNSENAKLRPEAEALRRQLTGAAEQ